MVCVDCDGPAWGVFSAFMPLHTLEMCSSDTTEYKVAEMIDR